MQSSKIKRREFIQLAALAAVSGSAVSCSRTKSDWLFLTNAEARTLEAMCEQIVPTDQDAGAREAGVVNYIDLQLTHFHYIHQATYRKGLAAVEASARASHGRDFSALAAHDQTKVLEAIEAGKAEGDWGDVNQKAFFALLLDHTMQGFYGDPRHGGNRDRVSWQMLGVAYVPVRGRTIPVKD